MGNAHKNRTTCHRKPQCHNGKDNFPFQGKILDMKGKNTVLLGDIPKQICTKSVCQHRLFRRAVRAYQIIKNIAKQNNRPSDCKNTQIGTCIAHRICICADCVAYSRRIDKNRPRKNQPHRQRAITAHAGICPYFIKFLFSECQRYRRAAAASQECSKSG